MNLDIFRAYDILGNFGVDFEPTYFYHIARAFAARFRPNIVAVGHDVRESSPLLWRHVTEALRDAGVDVLNLGQISTDRLTFVVAQYQTDGGIILSASHNPAAYNGIKLVRHQAQPLSSDTGLFAVREDINRCTLTGAKPRRRGTLPSLSFLDACVAHCRTFAVGQRLPTKRSVTNANGRLARHVAEHLLSETPIQSCKRFFTEPDGTLTGIPMGRPNLLRPENRGVTTQAVRQTCADLAVAWNADADRCFLFDETGAFLEGGTLTALLAAHLLEREGQGVVRFDLRAIWAVEAAVQAAHGIPVVNRCGHAFIKTHMRATDALFAGEASRHYDFHDILSADNGMIPCRCRLECLGTQQVSLAEAVSPRRAAYPVSGDINCAFETASTAARPWTLSPADKASGAHPTLSPY